MTLPYTYSRNYLNERHKIDDREIMIFVGIMSVILPLGSYANLTRLTEDPAYARRKHLLVKEIPSDAADKESLYLIQYDKRFLDINNTATLGMFRSVVVYRSEILSLAPPKAHPFSLLQESFPGLAEAVVGEIEVFVEGSMANVFYDKSIQSWQIATRTGIGGDYRFSQDKTKTFRTMFHEAMETVKMPFNILNREYSYSFIMQHPESGTVTSCPISNLILASVYSPRGSYVVALSRGDVRSQGAKIGVKTPRLLKELFCWAPTSPQAVAKIFAEDLVSHHIVGAVFHHKGVRTKLINPRYQEVRRLRDNSSVLQYQYYCLRQLGRAPEFIRQHPEHRRQCWTLRQQLHIWTMQLWRNYVTCYIRKKKEVKEFPKEFRPHMYRLHEKYLNELVREKLFITRRLVIDYVSSLPPHYLMYSVNYSRSSRPCNA